MNIEAKSAFFTVDNPNHWIVNSSIALANTVYVRNIFRTPNRIMSVSIFPHVKESRKVRDFFSTIPQCSIEHTKLTSEGLLVNLECKPSSLDVAMTQIVDKTGSRIWMRSNHDKFVDVYVECPWQVDLDDTISNILKRNRLKLINKIETKKQTMEVPLPFYDKFTELGIDDKDIRVAKKLFASGYFSTPRPKGFSQDKIADELKISKPILIERMRKIQSIGIRELLGIRAFSDEELNDTWNFIQSATKKRKIKN